MIFLQIFTVPFAIGFYNKNHQQHTQKKTIFSIKRPHIWEDINLLNVPCFFGEIKIKIWLGLGTIECVSFKRMENSMGEDESAGRLEIEFLYKKIKKFIK